MKEKKQDPVSFGNKSFCHRSLVASKYLNLLSEWHKATEDKVRVKKTFRNVKQSFVFLIIQSGLLKGMGWWRGPTAAHNFSEWNFPKSTEAEDTFFQFIKGSKLSVRRLSQLSWEEGTCFSCLHRNPKTGGGTLSQPLLAALDTVAHGFDFTHPSWFGPCPHKLAQRDK